MLPIKNLPLSVFHEEDGETIIFDCLDNEVCQVFAPIAAEKREIADYMVKSVNGYGELLETLEAADRLLDSFVKVAKAGELAVISMGVFREMATIKERITKMKGI